MESSVIDGTPPVDVFVSLKWLVLVKDVGLAEISSTTRIYDGLFCHVSGCSTLVGHRCPCSSFEKSCTPVMQKRKREIFTYLQCRFNTSASRAGLHLHMTNLQG